MVDVPLSYVPPPVTVPLATGLIRVVTLYIMGVKFAVIFLSLSIVNVTGLVVPVISPLQLAKTKSLVGVAVSVAIAPSLCVPSPVTAPLPGGLTAVATLWVIGTKFAVISLLLSAVSDRGFVVSLTSPLQ